MRGGAGSALQWLGAEDDEESPPPRPRVIGIYGTFGEIIDVVPAWPYTWSHFERYEHVLRYMHRACWLKRRHRCADGWTLLQARQMPIYWFGLLPTALFEWFLKKYMFLCGYWISLQ